MLDLSSMRCWLSAMLVSIAVGAVASPARAQAVPVTEPPDYFVDPYGKHVDFQPTYEGWFGSDRYETHLGRAIVENSALLGFELFLYWFQPSSNVVDWRFPSVWSKLESLDFARFDNNEQRTNWVLHPVAGAMHYGFTRANGYGIPASFFAAALSSTLYETVFEFREVISINDLIVTPFGGMALGEFFFHLSDYLNNIPYRPRTLGETVGWRPFARQAAGGTLGFLRSLHPVDDAARLPRLADDSLGFSSAYWHDFRIGIGYDEITNDQRDRGNAAVVYASAELAAMPGFMRPGQFETWFSDGNFTKLDMRFSFDEENARDVDLAADAHLFGHYEQSFDEGVRGLRGSAHEIAAHTAVHYVDRWLLGRRDQYAVLQPLAPIARFWFGRGATTLRFSADIAPEFASLHSAAYEGWISMFGVQGTKSSLSEHGYYFAAGGSAGAEASASFHGVTVTGKSRYGHYESIDGLEVADQEPVTRELHVRDDVLELSADLGYQPPELPVTIALSVAHFARTSNMPPVTTARTDDRTGISMGVRF